MYRLMQEMARTEMSMGKQGLWKLADNKPDSKPNSSLEMMPTDVPNPPDAGTSIEMSPMEVSNPSTPSTPSSRSTTPKQPKYNPAMRSTLTPYVNKAKNYVQQAARPFMDAARPWMDAYRDWNDRTRNASMDPGSMEWHDEQERLQAEYQKTYEALKDQEERNKEQGAQQTKFLRNLRPVSGGPAPAPAAAPPVSTGDTPPVSDVRPEDAAPPGILEDAPSTDDNEEIEQPDILEGVPAEEYNEDAAPSEILEDAPPLDEESELILTPDEEATSEVRDPFAGDMDTVTYYDEDGNPMDLSEMGMMHLLDKKAPDSRRKRRRKSKKDEIVPASEEEAVSEEEGPVLRSDDTHVSPGEALSDPDPYRNEIIGEGLLPEGYHNTVGFKYLHGDDNYLYTQDGKRTQLTRDDGLTIFGDVNPDTGNRIVHGNFNGERIPAPVNTGFMVNPETGKGEYYDLVSGKHLTKEEFIELGRQRGYANAMPTVPTFTHEYKPGDPNAPSRYSVAIRRDRDGNLFMQRLALSPRGDWEPQGPVSKNTQIINGLVTKYALQVNGIPNPLPQGALVDFGIDEPIAVTSISRADSEKGATYTLTCDDGTTYAYPQSGSASNAFIGTFISKPVFDQKTGTWQTYTGSFKNGKWVMTSKPVDSKPVGTPETEGPGTTDTRENITPEEEEAAKDFWNNVTHYVMLGVPIGAAIGLVMHMMGGKDSSLIANLLGGAAGGALLGGIGAYSGVLGGKTGDETQVATTEVANSGVN